MRVVSSREYCFYVRYVELCKEKGVSPTKAAEQMGIGRATVSRWKNNGTQPISQHLQLMSDFFNVSIDFLLSNMKSNTLNKEQEDFIFYDRFSELCSSKGKTPTGVGGEVGITKSTVSYWRQGNTPKPDALSKIAQYFNVSVDYLIGKSDIKTPPFSGDFVFYYRFLELCKQKGVPPSRVALENNLNKSTVTVWKKQAESGKEVSPQGDTLNALSEYFGVSVDYLLGKTDIKSPQPTSEDDELLLLLDELRNRPDMQMLFSVSKTAPPKVIHQAIKIIEILKMEDL